MTIIKRHNILDFAVDKPICVELGVAEGVFSEMILENHDVEHLYSIDMWAGDRGHDLNQYNRAVKRLLPYRENNSVIQSTFADAVKTFPDEFFDFIYIDGYAHTGQDNGQTLKEWWPKLKPGGIFSGDDYDIKEWPLTVKVVDQFSAQENKKLNVFDFQNEDNDHWCRFPSWYISK